MSALAAKDALAARIRHVSLEDRAADHPDAGSIFAVFQSDPATFAGLVSTRAVARFPRRIFVDLLQVEPQVRIPADGSAEQAVRMLHDTDAEALAVVDGSGAFLGALTRESCLDALLREERRLKAQLVFADRLVAMGTLAAGMAHEINNPLAFVAANVAQLAEAIGALDPLPPALAGAPLLLEDMREGTARIAAIVSDLQGFARGDRATEAPVDLRRALQSAINIARPQIRYRARLTTDLHDVGAVQGAAARVGQVFLNLLVNAAHAIPEGAVDQNRIDVRLYREGDQVHVVVADSGVGLTADTRAHLFEAFYTTKGPTQGTGLGLFVSHGIVAALGGSILVEDGIDRGCAFHVILPVAPLPVPCLPAASAPVGPPLPLRILLIDDEPLLLRALARRLRPHLVEVAADGPTALALLAEKGPFDAILCDMMMPEMSGIAVFHAACTRWPELHERFVVLTGGVFTDEGHAFLAAEHVPVLTKPVDERLLRATLADLARRRDERAPG